jgi:tRNA(adenine34) deaminase
MRMLTFYINRAGKNLSAERKRTLERAKEILHERVERSHSGTSTRKKAA